MRERRVVYLVLVRNPNGKGLLVRNRRRWEDNIKMDFQEMVWGDGLDRSESQQGQISGTCNCGNKLLFSIKSGEFLE
jgi:hypothetical protein